MYYNAVANLQLGKLDIAEKSAREAAKMDGAYRNPKINYVLGMILVKKLEFKEAGECLRAYLKSDVIADRILVTKVLSEIDRQLAAKADLNPEP